MRSMEQTAAHGAYFSDWLSKKRGLRRFHAETAVFYFLYTRQLKTVPASPTLSFMAGNQHSGHFIARSGWGDGETIVTLRATDHFGDHHHYDQGSFIIYRNGLLAVDPPVYRKVGGPQQPTRVHNTLLLDGQGQRPVRGGEAAEHRKIVVPAKPDELEKQVQWVRARETTLGSVDKV